MRSANLHQLSSKCRGSNNKITINRDWKKTNVSMPIPVPKFTTTAENATTIPPRFALELAKNYASPSTCSSDNNHDHSQNEKKETPESSPEIGVATIRFTSTPKMVESCSEDEEDDDKDDEEERDDDSVPPVPRKKVKAKRPKKRKSIKIQGKRKLRSKRIPRRRRKCKTQKHETYRVCKRIW